jgi:hypothetical protein
MTLTTWSQRVLAGPLTTHLLLFDSRMALSHKNRGEDCCLGCDMDCWKNGLLKSVGRRYNYSINACFERSSIFSSKCHRSKIISKTRDRWCWTMAGIEQRWKERLCSSVLDVMGSFVVSFATLSIQQEDCISQFFIQMGTIACLRWFFGFVLKLHNQARLECNSDGKKSRLTVSLGKPNCNGLAFACAGIPFNYNVIIVWCNNSAKWVQVIDLSPEVIGYNLTFVLYRCWPLT